MPPLRRSARLRRIKESVPDEERIYTRVTKRREIHHVRSPPADMDLPIFVQKLALGIWSDDIKLQLDATTELLNFVSVEDNLLIDDEVVRSGVVPRLVEFLTRDDCPQLQCEAARVLKNMASGTSVNIQVVVECGAVPIFVKLLGYSELKTCEQVAWSLGNIAGESSWHRDIVLSCGALHPLLTLLEEHKNLSFLRIGTWSLANIFEGRPKLPLEQLEFAIRVLRTLILTNDEEVLKEACWALFYVSQCGSGIQTAMYEADLCPKLAILYEPSRQAPLSVLYPAVRAVNSILSGSNLTGMHIDGVKRYILFHGLVEENAGCFVPARLKDEIKETHNLWEDAFEAYMLRKPATVPEVKKIRCPKM